MTVTPLYFELPANLSATKFITKLGKQLPIQVASQQYAIKTFYDSFDWRLYNADLICEFNHSQTQSSLRLIDKKTGKVLVTEELQDIPSFAAQFPKGHLRLKLDALLQMRALLPLCRLPHEVYRINILNDDEKTILRLQVDEYEHFNSRVALQPLKGYEKVITKVSDLLQTELALAPAECTALQVALKLQGRKAKDYSSKLVINLKPDMRADEASKIIYRYLLQAIKLNEAGTIADIDTEFLHDFRVAVRRTRAGLSQIKSVFPVATVAKYTEFFAWLGQITSLTRDLDVYLLSYQKYKAGLPISLHDDIEPLYDFLKEKQCHAQTQLAMKLKEVKYKKQLTRWEEFLDQPLPKKAKGNHAGMRVKALADQRIWKVYQRLLKEGEAISDLSAPEELHELRKTCKKLRYLMEFFQSLYAPQEISQLIKALKNFQSVLGDFQDYEVQEITLKSFSEEMMEQRVASNTLLAMGVLIQHLDSLKCAARNDFARQFEIFKQTENQQMFTLLFTTKA